VTPLKAIDRFTSLTIIGMTKIMCNTKGEVDQLISEPRNVGTAPENH
jgi:hypothetical protein